MKLLINISASIILFFITGCFSIKTVSDQMRLMSAVSESGKPGVSCLDEPAVRRLIDSGVDVNTPLPKWNGSTLLFIAVEENKPDLVKFLLEKGAKTNVKDNQGFTPLNSSALQQVNNTAQQQANSVKIAEMLLKNGADPNLGKEPPIIQACLSRNFKLIKLLVEYGADVNIKAYPNGTPLRCSVHDFQITELLISKGANVNAQDCIGDTVLMNALSYENPEKAIKIMKLLIEKGANINAVSHPWGQKEGETILDLVMRGYPKGIANFLRANGAKTAQELGVNADIDESGSNRANDEKASKTALNESNIKANEPNMQMSSDTVKAPAVMQIVQATKGKLSQIKGYTAKVERQVLDVNGGFDKFIEEQTVRCPDQMLVKGKVVAAHNRDTVGRNITTIIDGSNLYSRSDNKHYDDRSKKSFKEIEQNGGPSLRLFMAYMGNLADPFAIYKLDTLKLESETANEWVLTADYKQLPAMPYWLPRWTNRITIDKKSGLIKKLEALIKELEEPVILLDVKSVSTFSDASDIPESTFKVDSKTDGKL